GARGRYSRLGRSVGDAVDRADLTQRGPLVAAQSCQWLEPLHLGVTVHQYGPVHGCVDHAAENHCGITQGKGRVQRALQRRGGRSHPGWAYQGAVLTPDPQFVELTDLRWIRGTAGVDQVLERLGGQI